MEAFATAFKELVDDADDEVRVVFAMEWRGAKHRAEAVDEEHEVGDRLRAWELAWVQRREKGQGRTLTIGTGETFL